jgi:hypothetical protein
MRSAAGGMTSGSAPQEMNMPTYEISQHPAGNSYNVHVIGAQGTRQTMLGFPTKEEAEAWIVTDQERGPINREFRMAAADRLSGSEPTYLEEFLDHLTELESLLARNVVEWSAARARDAHARLSQLADEVGRIGSQQRDQL